MTPTVLNEVKQKVAMALIRSGMATMAEAAQLRGVTRQAMYKATRGGPDPHQARQQHLKEVWSKLLDKSS